MHSTHANMYGATIISYPLSITTMSYVMGYKKRSRAGADIFGDAGSGGCRVLISIQQDLYLKCMM